MAASFPRHRLDAAKETPSSHDRRRRLLLCDGLIYPGPENLAGGLTDAPGGTGVHFVKPKCRIGARGDMRRQIIRR
jgi:hypothetical protein